jgi:hypothetical protein
MTTAKPKCHKSQRRAIRRRTRRRDHRPAGASGVCSVLDRKETESAQRGAERDGEQDLYARLDHREVRQAMGGESAPVRGSNLGLRLLPDIII